MPRRSRRRLHRADDQAALRQRFDHADRKTRTGRLVNRHELSSCVRKTKCQRNIVTPFAGIRFVSGVSVDLQDTVIIGELPGDFCR